MKIYCIYIPGLPVSEELAKRCITSAQKYHVEVDLFEGTPRYQAYDEAKALGIAPINKIGHPVLRDNQLGCFISHYRLWLQCMLSDEIVGIVEHDATFVNRLELCEKFRHVLNIQKGDWSDPQWEYYEKVSLAMLDNSAPKDAASSGVVPCAFKCLPSTCAYLITPDAARILVDEALGRLLKPVDLFVNKDLLELEDLIPFPVTQENRVSTVAPDADWSGYQNAQIPQVDS